MKLTILPKFDVKKDVLVLGLFEEDKDNCQKFSAQLAEEISGSVKNKQFAKKFGDVYSTKLADQPYHKILVLGLGKKKELTEDKVRSLLGKAVKYTKCSGQKSFTTDLLEKVSSLFEVNVIGRFAAEAVILADYNFVKYLNKEKQDKKKPLLDICFMWTGKDLTKSLQEGRLIAESTNFTRDLVNEPANLVNSVYLEGVAKKLVSSSPKLKLKVLDEAEMRKLGMGALLGVNAGSKQPPKLLIIEYKNGSGQPTALIGKGITFDSGGYNLKPTKYIEDMKIDMAGATAVLGTMQAAVNLSVKKNLLGVMALCENMVSSSAQHPGDIVKAYNGKTIEIGNTDAEGRLVLADALAYIEDKYKPSVMIDLATLTGACVVALGYYAAAVVSNDEKLSLSLKKAGMASGDKVWPLPFFEEYHDWMDGSITDLNNIATKGKGYEAGSITAGVFLSKFVKETKWAHIDIAGSAYWEVKNGYLQKGATGSGVRVLSYWLLDN
jgi:leucyl aminopeptidase